MQTAAATATPRRTVSSDTGKCRISAEDLPIRMDQVVSPNDIPQMTHPTPRMLSTKLPNRFTEGLIRPTRRANGAKGPYVGKFFVKKKLKNGPTAYHKK